MNIFSRFLNVVLIILLAVMVYFFIIRGEVYIGDDQREVITLTKQEKNLILAEMRDLLGSVQVIIDASLSNNHKEVEKTALLMGTQAKNNIPVKTLGKLPIEFKRLGYNLHQAYDEIALDAYEQLGTAHTLTQVSHLLKVCISCHTAYRIDEQRKPAVLEKDNVQK